MIEVLVNVPQDLATMGSQHLLAIVDPDTIPVGLNPAVKRASASPRYSISNNDTIPVGLNPAVKLLAAAK